MEAASQPAGRARVLHALRSRDFRLLWGGQTVSLIGNAAFFVAIGWKTVQLTGSARSLAFVLLLESVAMMTTLLLGGALADRYPRRTVMEKGLYACDEITGLVTATALLRPTGIGDLTASSVRKKMKSKGFARGVNRDDVVRGAAEFGVDLDEHIQFVIDAMKGIAAELGLEKGAPGGEPPG